MYIKRTNVKKSTKNRSKQLSKVKVVNASYVSFFHVGVKKKVSTKKQFFYYSL